MVVTVAVVAQGGIPTYSQLIASNVITAGVIVITTCDITIDATADGVAVVAVIAMRLVTSPSLRPSA